MSYDISLVERISGKTIELPKGHVMTGGTYQAEYDAETNTFYPAATKEAWLNITYNYGRYYYEAAEGDERFYGGDGEQTFTNLGIRGIYGKSGAESIPMLQDLAARIEAKYNKNGKWIKVRRIRKVYRDKNGEEIAPIDVFTRKIEGTEEIEYEANEGPNDDYWTATAANAIRPLYQLLAFAQLRPDGVWDGD